MRLRLRFRMCDQNGAGSRIPSRSSSPRDSYPANLLLDFVTLLISEHQSVQPEIRHHAIDELAAAGDCLSIATGDDQRRPSANVARVSLRDFPQSAGHHGVYAVPD